MVIYNKLRIIPNTSRFKSYITYDNNDLDVFMNRPNTYDNDNLIHTLEGWSWSGAGALSSSIP